MEKRKSIMVDEELHKRLKTHCASQGISIGSYVDNCIHQSLFDDLDVDKKTKLINDLLQWRKKVERVEYVR